MDGHQTPATSSIDCQAWPVEIEGIRDAVGHDGDPVAGCSVLWLPVGIPKADLLVVYALLVIALAKVPP
jgi:hypothetical protein